MAVWLKKLTFYGRLLIFVFAYWKHMSKLVICQSLRKIRTLPHWLAYDLMRKCTIKGYAFRFWHFWLKLVKFSQFLTKTNILNTHYLVVMLICPVKASTANRTGPGVCGPKFQKNGHKYKQLIGMAKVYTFGKPSCF